MAYDAFLKRQVRLAFKQAKDLAKPVSLQQKNVTSFDFATQTTVATTLVTTESKCIVNKEWTDKDSESSSIFMEIVVSAEDISNPDIYDKAVIEGITWDIIPPYVNDGYTITLRLSREA